MYRLRYFVCVWLVVQGLRVAAQDQVGVGGSGATVEPSTLQTPQSNDEIRPLVDPLAASAGGESHHEQEVVDAALPRTPIQDFVQAALNPAEQTSHTLPVEATSAANVAPASQTPIAAVPTDTEEKIVEPKGIDTVDVKEPEGNWLFKRIWWEKSKEIYGKIRERVDKIIESRMHFFRERVKLDREVLDPFYVDLGLDRGALEESISHLLELLQKDRDQDGTLSVAAQEKLAALQEEKAAITKLGESVSGVQEIDQQLDEALEKLMNQINLARSYESEAWQLLDKIAEELSDKKAREHYYAIATLWRNVKEIGNYIQGPFAHHFIQLAQASVQNVQNIKSIANLLEQKGFALKERIELPLKEDVDKQAEEDDEDVWPKQELGWGSWIWKKITGWFSW